MVSAAAVVVVAVAAAVVAAVAADVVVAAVGDGAAATFLRAGRAVGFVAWPVSDPAAFVVA